MSYFDWNKARKDWQTISCQLWANAPKIRKKFYTLHPEIKSLSDNENVDLIRESLGNIIVYAEGPDPVKYIPHPILEFKHAFHEYPDILEEIERHGFMKPSPIQSQLWPIALSGYDSIAIAQTGTGKTLGFLLPSFIHAKFQCIDEDEVYKRPKVLVLCPTRELALQIQSEFNKFTELLGNYRSVCVYGGVNKKDQIGEIERGCTFIIATPGRLIDLTTYGKDLVDLSLISFVVLDEADRMLDLGFEPQIIRILSQMRPDRQTLLTSATWPSDIQRLASKYLMNPIRIHVGSIELNAVKSIHQSFIFTYDEQKFNIVINMIKEMSNEKIVVFCSRKGTCSHLSSELMFKGVACTSIHGDMSQEDRIASLQDFRFNEFNILIGTDVASRGIDIVDVTLVINYDMPKSVEDYIHRIGRTGRAGRKGKAISLFTEKDAQIAPGIISILKKANQEIPEKLVYYRDNPKKIYNNHYKKRSHPNVRVVYDQDTQTQQIYKRISPMSIKTTGTLTNGHDSTNTNKKYPKKLNHTQNHVNSQIASDFSIDRNTNKMKSHLMDKDDDWC